MQTDFKSTALAGTKALLSLTYAVVGLGLIGGSYLKALRSLGVAKLIGVECDASVLAAAEQQQLVDVALSKAGPELLAADVIICAIYPDDVVPFLTANRQYFRTGALLTDVAGIKGSLPYAAQAVLLPGQEFLSGHPMAGRQGSGFAMSAAEIFHNANYIIVPTQQNTAQAITLLKQLALSLGCKRTVSVTPEQHDRIIAFTSNLPHVTAVALMDSASFDEKSKYFVAGSFRDATRVADINPELWEGLFLANRENVAAEIDKYIEQLEQWRTALLANDGGMLKRLMRQAAERRKDLYDGNNP